MAEKERGLPVFDTDILNAFFFPTAGIATWSSGKISAHTPVAKGLRKGGGTDRTSMAVCYCLTVEGFLTSVSLSVLPA